jgi:TrmH family RNA methyltransferase
MSSPEKLSVIRFRAARLLLNKKHRLREGKCIIEGGRFVAEALQAGSMVDTVLVTGDFASGEAGRELVALARRAGAEVRTITTTQLAGLSDTVTAQGVVAIVRLPGVPLGSLLGGRNAPSLLVALDGVADPGNTGTIIRTCAWFGADGVILGEGTAELSNPKVLRSTMGAVFSLPVVAGADLLHTVQMLKGQGYRVVLADARGTDSDGVFGGGAKVLMIFGSEARGIRPEIAPMADALYGIPRFGSGESLNVAVSVGVALSRYRLMRG